MMKSAMIGAVAGFFAFLAAWVGWGYVTGKFDRTSSPARVVMKPASAPSALPVVMPALGASPSPNRTDVGSGVAVARSFERFEGTAVSAIELPPVPVAATSLPSVSTVPAPAVVASVLPEQPPVGPTVVRTVISTPPSPVVASPVESIAPAVVAVAAVAPTVPALVVSVSNDAPSAVAPTRTLEQSVPASQPTRSEADVARTQQAVAKFAAAQDALRNFRLQMPAMQAPATVAASEARVVAASTPTPDSPAVQPTAVRQRNIPPAATATASAPVPLVSFPGKSPDDAAGLTELDTLSRAAEAMKRLSKKLGSPRIR